MIFLTLGTPDVMQDRGGNECAYPYTATRPPPKSPAPTPAFFVPELCRIVVGDG